MLISTASDPLEVSCRGLGATGFCIIELTGLLPSRCPYCLSGSDLGAGAVPFNQQLAPQRRAGWAVLESQRSEEGIKFSLPRGPVVLPLCWPVGLKLSAPPKRLLALPTGAESHCPQDLITKRVGALVSATWEQLSPLRRNNKSGSCPPGSWSLAEEGLRTQ